MSVVINFDAHTGRVVKAVSLVTLVLAQVQQVVQQLKKRHGTECAILTPNKSKKNKRP